MASFSDIGEETEKEIREDVSEEEENKPNTEREHIKTKLKETEEVVIEKEKIKKAMEENLKASRISPKYISFSAVIIVFSISIALFNSKYVWQYFFTDDPIFRDLANSTTILVEDIVNFNVPASSDVIKLRETSSFLSDIISVSSTDASYLQTLGDKAYIAGAQVEKIYNTGSLVFDEMFNELQDIWGNLPQPSQDSQDSLITQKHAEYFLARFRQILNLMTRFHGKFVDIEKTVREIQALYHGNNNTQGFSNIIKYFDENESKHQKIYDMKMVQRELDFERDQLEKLVIIDHEVIRVRKSLDLSRKEFNSFIERINYLSNKKIVTQEDGQMLEKVIEIVGTAKEVWGRIDGVDYKRIEN